MIQKLKITLDRNIKTSLTEQIRMSIEQAIISGVLREGDRLPSWIDLASQLGVSRGTVQIAYEKLVDRQFVIASKSQGTRVAPNIMYSSPPIEVIHQNDAFMKMYIEMTSIQGVFQLGVPSKEHFPSKLFAKIRSKSVRSESSGWPNYPDPRGEYTLRREICAYLALSRGIQCTPDQVLITSGFSGGLGLCLHALGLSRKDAWVEDPGFPFSKHALRVAGFNLCPIPVDQEGINIDYAKLNFPNASIALVTPGQQAPLGMPLSLTRRMQLLNWANQNEMWIIEDDYLGELQLDGRATPALFSLDRMNRVIHLGSFSKTLSPKLRIGFAVVPMKLLNRFEEVTATLTPAPAPSLQHAIQEFMHEGHFLRHLRRTKRVYGLQRNVLIEHLQNYNLIPQTAGLSILIKLAPTISDQKIAREALALGLAPVPLSSWYLNPKNSISGLMLGIATTPISQAHDSCNKLFSIISENKKPL
nr:PLP-dependent aminotransferase family protein [Acinetobacter sp. Marseille-Q1620]